MINDTEKFMALCVIQSKKTFLWTYETQAYIPSSFRSYPKVISLEMMSLTP